MPKELKEQLKADMEKRFAEQKLGDGFIDKIADEEIATTVQDVRAYMEKVSHPALKLEDMTVYMQSEEAKTEAAEQPAEDAVPINVPQALADIAESWRDGGVPQPQPAAITAADIDINALSEKITAEVTANITNAAKDIVGDIINVLAEKFLGEHRRATNNRPKKTQPVVGDAAPSVPQTENIVPPPVKVITAAERIADIRSFNIPKEKSENQVLNVTLGSKKPLTIGGADCMPFHLWEGKMPSRPLIAMEVFDLVSEKFPAVLSEIYGDILHDPAEMAKLCLDKYGADLISVRLEGTHPEKGNKSVQDAVELVGKILKAVDVPLIITGHSSFEKNNEVMKAVAQAYEGENLLFNWVEQDNYKTIAGAAMAYGHTLVAQSPIDVNISKQLNILLTNMGLAADKIIIDPMTSTIGYGIEYTYSVMERIRQTGLGGDKMLCSPMLVSVGQECMKIKEAKASEKDFPAWGNLAKRAAYWEISTASSLLYAGADILIMYHPDAVKTVRKTIFELMDKKEKKGEGI
jgi:acetyl-CoA decarbonylase/synthase complex subunit delta